MWWLRSVPHLKVERKSIKGVIAYRVTHSITSHCESKETTTWTVCRWVLGRWRWQETWISLRAEESAHKDKQDGYSFKRGVPAHWRYMNSEEEEGEGLKESWDEDFSLILRLTADLNTFNAVQTSLLSGSVVHGRRRLVCGFCSALVWYGLWVFVTPQIRSACSGSFFADTCRGVEPHSQESTFVELCFCLLATGFELIVYRLRLGEHVSEVGSLNLVSVQVCLFVTLQDRAD